MKANMTFDHALLKFWFTGGISRNLSDVTQIVKSDSVLTVYNGSGTTYIINFNNVSMIEEIHQ